MPIGRGVVQRAGSATLRPAASQGIEVAQVLEHFFDRHLPAKCGEVEPSTFAMLRVRAPGGLACLVTVGTGRPTLLAPQLAGPLDHDFRVVFEHRLADLPVHHVSAVAVEDTAQMIEGAADVQMTEIDVPVTVRTARLMEALPFPLVGRRRTPQPIGRLQHPIHRGRARRHYVVVDHHERQTPIAFQGVLTLIVEDRPLLLVRQPVITGDARVVLVDAAVTLPLVVELREADAQPKHQHVDGDFRLL